MEKIEDEFIAYSCPNCGGSIDPITYKCSYCGTYFKKSSTENNRFVIKYKSTTSDTLKVAVSMSSNYFTHGRENSEKFTEYAVRHMAHTLAESLIPYMNIKTSMDYRTNDIILSGEVRVERP